MLSTLMAYRDLRARSGYHGQCAEADLHAWIVDTSTELVGQSVGGLNVVSRGALEFILRDEMYLLWLLYQLDEDEPGSSCQEGFSAEHFVAVVEPDQLWGGI